MDSLRLLNQMTRLAKLLINIIGEDINIVKDGSRIRPKKSEVNRLLVNNEKAKKLVGWSPEMSFESGLKITIDWIKNNIKLFKTDKYIV